MELLIIISVIILIIIIVENNNIIKLKNKVKQSKSTIDVYLKKRIDLIPNLVKCVEKYMEYEKDTLELLLRERMEYINNTNNIEKAQKIIHDSDNLLIIAENYPELKASEQFIKLQNAIIEVEDELQAARRLYNSDATIYNIKITKFPTMIIAHIFNHKEFNLFQLEK